jgi:hypothetical protein
MKARIVLLALVVLLTTGGWDCFNSDITVPVDVKFSSRYPINPGATSYSGVRYVSPKDTVDQNFQDNLAGGRLYDVQVRVTGSFSGASVTGSGSVNDSLLVTYAGPWDSLKTWQSILGGSKYIKLQDPGRREVSRILAKLSSGPLVKLSGSGTVSGAISVPAGLAVEVQVLGQADALMK